MRLKSVFIVSIPRSGSTVLTNLLGQYQDVLCPPETFFPGVLEFLTHEEMRDKRRVAALFVASCSDGSPLTLVEAEACISDDKGLTLEALAFAIASKNGLNSENIQVVVWKFTRMIGCWKFAASLNGKFIVLRRNLPNVYESQFRVHFGDKNRNPLRFALFATSYEIAFAQYPKQALLAVNYMDIPSRMTEIIEWIGSSGKLKGKSNSLLKDIVQTNPWHANISKPFENKDSEKIRNLTMLQSSALSIGISVFRQLHFITQRARIIADQRQMAALRDQASTLMKNSQSLQS